MGPWEFVPALAGKGAQRRGAVVRSGNVRRIRPSRSGAQASESQLAENSEPLGFVRYSGTLGLVWICAANGCGRNRRHATWRPRLSSPAPTQGARSLLMTILRSGRNRPRQPVYTIIGICARHAAAGGNCVSPLCSGRSCGAVTHGLIMILANRLETCNRRGPMAFAPGGALA